MQKQILAKNPAELRVYAVWFNMLYTDARSEWPRHLLNDPRVVHLWDEKKIVGQWAARQVTTYYGVDPSLLPRNVLWDAYLLYAPEARWDDSRLDFINWGRTIIATREELRKHLKRFFGEGAASLAVMVTVVREPERRQGNAEGDGC